MSDFPGRERLHPQCSDAVSAAGTDCDGIDMLGIGGFRFGGMNPTLAEDNPGCDWMKIILDATGCDWM